MHVHDFANFKHMKEGALVNLTLIIGHLWLSGLTMDAQAQEPNKYEREYRVSASEVPAAARRFVDSCGFERRIRWYREESLNEPSYEAKVRHGGHQHSIEFDTLGTLEDVEISWRQRELPDSVASDLSRYLNETFRSWRIKKIQLQWLGPPQVVRALIRGKTPAGAYQLRYELIVIGRNTDGREWYELLLDDQGSPLMRRRIIHRNTDHLDY